MACLDNIVSLRELCEEPETFSGIYLNELGITRAFIESVITSDYDDPADFLEKKTAHSIKIVQTAIHSIFGASVRSTSLVHDHRLGYTAKNMPVSTGGDWKGIQLTLSNYSNYINVELASVSLQVNSSGTVSILVYDLYQNKLLETIPVTAIAGEIVTVYPHSIYQSDGRPLNLFIGYNATGLTSITTYIRENQCCGNVTCTNQYMQAKGVTNNTGHFIDEDMSGMGHTAGLSLVYSLSCDPYSWMCSYARVLALPLAYKIASEMYQHGIMNAVNYRSSNTTNLNVDGMNATRLFLESEYDRLMKSLLENMRIPEDSACFQCNAPTRTAIVLP